MRLSKLLVALWASSALAGPALGQTAPTAGQVLREIGQTPQQPHDVTKFDLTPPPAAASADTGTATAEIRSATIVGNTVFDAAVLKAQLGDFQRRRYTLAEMRALADRIAAYYRRRGFPFTRVLLPPQDLSGGDLRIQVVEGRYGRVTPAGDPSLAAGATPFLKGLKPGSFIEANRLERSVLILNDQPGMKVLPTIRPGSGAGTGDFAANTQRVARFGGDIGFDNEGSRYVGEYRGKFNAFAYSPFSFGDQVTLRGMYSDLGMWLGSLDYERPLNGSGLRGQIAAAQTDYQLGDQFSSLKDRGYAQVFDVRLKYPIVRSRKLNISVFGGPEYKRLEDKFGALGVVNHKSSLSWPVTLQFDDHDRLLGGGVTYGSLSVVRGDLHLSPDLIQPDSTTARTGGVFTRVDVDVSRIQALAGPVSLFGRVSAQWSDKNLDSSEKFVLGGYYGVRAYPVGEGMSDRAWLLQSEARWDLGLFKPYALFDIGQAQTNARPWDSASHGRRDLAGAGLGVRFNYRHWFVDGAIAGQVQGGPSTSDRKNVDPHPWIDADYRF